MTSAETIQPNVADARKKRLDQIGRLIAVSSEMLDVEPAMYALPCRKAGLKRVLTGQIFTATKNLLAVVDEMMAELRASTPEGEQ
ncbi:hypothetical protein CCR94_10620 [Rhodoblastus sphagnicola]|uniref:Uncharacterized protein n=1 Tax=Rhodoblastus sphagnicola TaxID=333368 RepID=A0A2S6N8R6_9HYPH|nr:hypothetical protein [Rhodoblastus sphagnicola]MBB4201141.1 hypothetical protein [Rhodoblastus sphagnicola]PPQ31004.1 hypothetical protein CCR94_10620 [Rhodoblastus sphagnicola]